MKRNNLTTAVIAGIAGVAGIANMAGAVNLNPDGLGQVLIYPYFTVNANNQTLLSVVNTQNAGKAVKVRFLEGYDSREVLDFNLYLSPYDVWTATVFDTTGVPGRPQDGTAEGGLLTPDNSCTDPAIKTGSAFTEVLPDGRNFVAFVNFAYAGANSDNGPEGLERTRTGHIELIEMATVVGATLKDITHVNGVPPCKTITGATGGADYLTPTGGLFGTGSIVNTLAGTLYGYNADAVDGFYTNTGNLFNPAGTIAPDLTNGDNGGNVETSFVFNNGALITSSWTLSNGGSIDAVSSVFTADHIYNEYELNPTTGAVASEWVITFPTKRYYVDPANFGSPFAPFTKVFGDDSSNPNTACEPVTLNEYDREERTPQRVTGFSPPRPGVSSPVLCWEAQVVTFQSSTAAGSSTASPIFGSPLFTNVDTLHDIGPTGTSGWINITLSGNGHLLDASNEGNVFAGLPVTGFLAKDFTNKNVTPGILGNYAGLYRHRTSRTCTNTNGICS